MKFTGHYGGLGLVEYHDFDPELRQLAERDLFDADFEAEKRIVKLNRIVGPNRDMTDDEVLERLADVVGTSIECTVNGFGRFIGKVVAAERADAYSFDAILEVVHEDVTFALQIDDFLRVGEVLPN